MTPEQEAKCRAAYNATDGRGGLAKWHSFREGYLAGLEANAKELATVVWDAAYFAGLEAKAKEMAPLLQPFIGHNSSEEFVTIRVRTADVARARAAITQGAKP